jgi:hypothetical protein
MILTVSFESHCKAFSAEAAISASVRVSVKNSFTYAENRGNGASVEWCDWHGSQLAGESPVFAL